MGGIFIQPGVTPSTLEAIPDGVGKFVTVQDLEQLERDRVADQLRNVRPDLLAEGVRVIRAKLEADEAFEKLRRDLHGAVGGDGVRTATAMMTAQANAQIAQSKAEKATQAATKPAARK